MPPYDHPDWNALLAGIVAHPDADLPRLVAADWLEENGEPDRAAFIRLQIERETDDRPELKWEEERYRNTPTGLPLWAEEACPSLVGPRFSGGSGLVGVSYSGVEKVRFRRGFPDAVTCTAEEWERFGALVLPRQPVRQLLLRECRQPGLQWWAMLPTLRHLRTLALEDGDYPLLRFLRTELPTVDVVRHAPPPVVLPATAAPRPVAPPPRPVPPPLEGRPAQPSAG